VVSCSTLPETSEANAAYVLRKIQVTDHKRLCIVALYFPGSIQYILCHTGTLYYSLTQIETHELLTMIFLLFFFDRHSSSHHSNKKISLSTVSDVSLGYLQLQLEKKLKLQPLY